MPGKNKGKGFRGRQEEFQLTAHNADHSISCQIFVSVCFLLGTVFGYTVSDVKAVGDGWKSFRLWESLS